VVLERDGDVAATIDAVDQGRTVGANATASRTGG